MVLPSSPHPHDTLCSECQEARGDYSTGLQPENLLSRYDQNTGRYDLGGGVLNSSISRRVEGPAVSSLNDPSYHDVEDRIRTCVSGCDPVVIDQTRPPLRGRRVHACPLPRLLPRSDRDKRYSITVGHHTPTRDS